MRAAVAGLALLLAPMTSGAAPRPITLSEAVALAQRNAVSVIGADGQSRNASAGVRAAGAAFLPSLSVSAGATRQLPAGASTRVDNGQIITVAQDPWSSNMGVGATLQLFEGGRRLFQLSQAKSRHTSAEAGEVMARFGAALAAKQSYFDILAARESEGAAAAQLRQAEQQRVVSIAKTRAKTATRSDSLRAEIQVRTAQQAVSDAATALASADVTLARTIGVLGDVTAADETLPEPTLALEDSALAALAAHGPAVLGAEADLAASRAARRIAWTAYLPSVSASWSRSGSGTANTPDFGSGALGYNGSLRLSLSFPLFDGLQREQQVTQADVSLRNAEAALRDAQLAARQSVVQSLGSWHASAERVVLQAATVQAAEEDLRVQQQRYAVGESTQLDVLTSQTLLDQARRDLIRARYDQRVAKAQLEALAGRDL